MTKQPDPNWPEGVRAYRSVVVAKSACPYCKAEVGQKCLKPNEEGSYSNQAGQPLPEIDYVHDDRSMVHYLDTFSSMINSIVPSPAEPTDI